MELPLYLLQINEADEAIIDEIAQVEHPAHMSGFLAFSEEHKRFNFSDEKMELIGAAVIPDIRIYRRDEQGEYDVMFTKEETRKAAQIFMKKGFQSNVNLDHTDKDAKSFIYQSYIVSEEHGMPSPKGLNLPEGTWVVGMKVTDPQVWADIKSGKRQGFSVEGVFKLLRAKFNRTPNTNINKETAEIANVFDSIANRLKKFSHE